VLAHKVVFHLQGYQAEVAVPLLSVLDLHQGFVAIDRVFMVIPGVEPGLVRIVDCEIDHQATSRRVRSRPLVDQLDVRTAWENLDPIRSTSELREPENFLNNQFLVFRIQSAFPKDVKPGKQGVVEFPDGAKRPCSNVVRWQPATVNNIFDVILHRVWRLLLKVDDAAPTLTQQCFEPHGITREMVSVGDNLLLLRPN